ncbi:MAG: IreB family regulatory phosphoprotein [Clostridia bacterium]|nr:IreB family regulatory phosphoprotein [Clostridia bacterium]
MDTRLWDEKIQNIISALENAGYDPYAQMRGFLMSGDARFITQSGGAREMILTIDPHYLQRYLNTLRREQEVKRYV